MNRRIILSGTTIVASLALMVGGTFAFFSDEGTSSGNTLTAGTLTLLLNGAEDISTNIFTVADMAPGDVKAATIGLSKDGSSIDIAKVGFKSEADNDTFGADLLLRVHEGGGIVGGLCDGAEVTSDIESDLSLGAGELTVDNFTAFFDSLFDGAVTGASTATFSNTSTNTVCLEVEFVEDANNDNQGESTDVTFTFKALQSALDTP